MCNQKKRHRIFSVAVPIISVAIALVIVEIVLFATGFSFKLYPEKVQFGWPQETEIVEMFERDKDLVWVPKNYYQNLDIYKKNHPTIAFMGCSCTHFGVYDKLFADIVGREYPEKKVTYANLGVGGWSSFQGLLQMKRDVVQIKPKLVTIYYGWNDHWIGYGIEDKDVQKINESFGHSFSLQNLRFVQLFTKFLVKIQQKPDRPERVSASDFRDNLENMIEIARSDGIIPVLLTAPTSHEKGKEPAYLAQRWLRNLNDLVPLHQKYISIVRQVAESQNAALCDLAREFEKMPHDLVADKYFMQDGIHLQKEGDAEIAKILFNCLKNNGLLKKIL
jgi:lysophospholipase L1-like esterase